MDTLRQDLRYALRSLAKSPGFTFLTLLTLALGIGANSGIFTVVNAVLLRPLQYREPDRLVVARETYSGGTVGTVSGPNFLDWRDRSRSFEGMTASRGFALSLLEGGEPEDIRSAQVTAEFFQVLGVDPVLGRGFLPGEDQGQPAVVVIGEQLWRTRFNADGGILGRVLTLGGRPYTVVGVAPEGLIYPGRSQMWIPLGFGVGRASDRDSHSYDVVGRLKPGVTIEQAQADLAAIARALEKEEPATNSGRSAITVPLDNDTIGGARPALLMLTGAVALVLLIACANVANLFLARAATRHREIAVRAALGAGRWRLARQVLVEAVTLAGAGGVLGLLLASWAVDVLVALQPRGIPRLQEIGIDGAVLGFTLAVSLAVGVVFGVVPALSLSAQDPADSFRGEGRGTSAGRQRSRFRAALVVAQISLALVLVVGAALLIVSLRRLTDVDPGFRPRGAVVWDLTIPTAKYADAEVQRNFVARLIDGLEAIPGVSQVGTVFFLPLGSGDASGDISIEGDAPSAPGQERYAGYRMVAGNFLEAMGLEVRRGRKIGPEDAAGTPAVAVVNETLVRKFFGDRDPIGQRITFGAADEEAVWREIVGVVGDTRHRDLATDPFAEVYVPSLQLEPDFWAIFTPIPLSFVVRSDRPVEALAPEIKAAIREVDPEQPISRVRPAAELITDSVARQRFSVLLLTVFGGLALTLAAVGVYGVMAYALSQRTRELGIRLVLGARASSVWTLVLRQVLAMALAGVGIGLLAALALGRLVSSLLYEVSPNDPGVLAVVALLLSTISLVACLVPAIRATRVDSIEALRSE